MARGLRAMARLGLLLTAIAAGAALLAPSAQAAQFATDGFGLAGPEGPNLPHHNNQFTRDGLASSCGDGMGQSSPTITPGVRRAYKSRAFTSLIHEDACVTVSVSTSCSGANEIMSASFSPAFDPETINSNWIGDLGNSPPSQTSYAFPVAAGARFETVASEQEPTANCGGVDLTWSADRPWARGRPAAFGVPAIGRTLARGLRRLGRHAHRHHAVAALRPRRQRTARTSRARPVRATSSPTPTSGTRSACARPPRRAASPARSTGGL